MKILQRSSDIVANPTPEALSGYSLDKELTAAARTALKPIAKRLREYRSEVARMQANVERWSPDAFAAKLDEITTRAHQGDAEAVAQIESGAIASRQSYAEMHGRACRELEEFERTSRGLFAEALELVRQPMTAAVDRGQAILDSVLTGCGVPLFPLAGYRNHCAYVWKQLEHASRNESADLHWFWSSVE